MPTTPAAGNCAPIQNEAPYQDLLGTWSDLEAALSLLFAQSSHIAEPAQKIADLCTWLQELISHDTDSALYAMCQLTNKSTAEYGVSHTLACATLSHILALHFALPSSERQALVRAAFTFNMVNTGVQNPLVLQRDKPSPAQQQALRHHRTQTIRYLERLGIQDKLWLDIVSLRHIHRTEQLPLMKQAAAERLARILTACDRFAALVYSRRTFLMRSVADLMRALQNPKNQQLEHLGEALIRSVGLFPPGTYVALSTGETAVVLRRTHNLGLPLVGTLLNPRKAPLRHPTLITTSAEGIQITHALPAHEINIKADPQTMMRLGMYATQFKNHHPV